jgi:RNA polymerase sigma-70 factor (ECF subfamily)
MVTMNTTANLMETTVNARETHEHEPADPPGRGWEARVGGGLRQGSPEAFRELVERTEDSVRRLLGRLQGRCPDLDDQVQEVYLRAWRGLAGFRGGSRLSTWLYRIAVNVARNRARGPRPTIGLPEEVGRSLAAPPSIGEDELLALYERALARLAEEVRTTFVLHEAQGLSYQATAEVLGCPIGTVMSRLHRARTSILEYLREHAQELIP